MTDDPVPEGTVVPPHEDPGERERRKEQKARRKMRSAWISFMGRILAQVIGAAASVTLGVLIAHKVSKADRVVQAAPVVEPAAAPRAASDGLSLAVLPLDNFTGDPAHGYLADAMTEAMSAELSRVRRLRVVSRTSVMQYKSARKPLPQIARELGADVVIEGSVMRSGSRVRVVAQLVDAHEDRHLWAGTYDRDLRDVLALQDDVARSVAAAVGAVLATEQPALLLADVRRR
jgi:TolB-like protein